jgi:putative two-component system response regulator
MAASHTLSPDQVLRAPAPVSAQSLAAFREASALGWDDVIEEQETPAQILVVDGNDISRRLLKALLKNGPYRFLEARRASEALGILEREKVDLMVLDLMIPEMSGPEFCRRIKSDRNTRFVPVLMLTSVQGVENEIHGLESGADEYLIKPYHPAVIRSRVRSMLRNKAAIDSLEEAEGILFALAQTVESRDTGTGAHCHRLARLSVAMGRVLGLSRRELQALYRGGFLHDIGKVGIPDCILLGPGALTEEEWQVMRMHTVWGEQICRPMKSLAPVLPIIRSHHERWDGTGYPDGLMGEEIPLLARILQVVDIFDALTTARSYKPRIGREQAMRILDDEASRGWRDPELVPIFINLLNGNLGELPPDAEAPSQEDSSIQVSLENMNRHLAYSE